MTKNTGDRLTAIVAVFGAAASLCSLSAAGTHAGLSTAAGALLALLNLLVLRITVLRVMDGELHTKLPLLALIFVKMGVLFALVYSAITRGWVEPIAFTVGLSSLVVGLITGSLLLSRTSPKSEY